MRVGSLVYATDQGLGILAKSFYDHGVVTDVLVIRHGRHHTHDEWYPRAQQISSLNHQVNEMANFCATMDAMLFFETPFHWPLIDFCRNAGVKTILMPMHECLHRNVWNHLPDLFLCPSELDLQVVDESYDGSMQMFLPVPVEIPWRQRTKAEVFVHNAGHGGLKGRNGTAELLAAWSLVKSPAQLLMRYQGADVFWDHVTANRERLLIKLGTTDYNTLFVEGDVFVFPEKFNGLSLPLQEARAAGMLVMCGDRFPMNQWLPNESLIQVAGYRKNRIGPPYNEFDEAMFDPKAIAEMIDWWYGRNITDYSLQGKAWAESMSWEALKPKYMKVLEDLCA